MKKSAKYLFAGPLLLLLAACIFIAAAGQAKQHKGAQKSDADARHAQELWKYMKDYTTWPVPEGFEGWQDGISPHGKYLRYYVNYAAKEDLTKEGAVLVKENYSRKSEDALQSITVMQKRKGYDPETKDWFYVKYSPDGKVMTDDNGRRIAGLVGKGEKEGCVPCHATAGGDYLFMTE